MGGPGSGGQNKLSIEQHLARGTFRPARHLLAVPAAAPVAPVADADRRAVRKGLGTVGRRVVDRLLADYDGWDIASLHTLRNYAVSCERLAALEHDDDGRRAETRINLALVRSLHLESPR